MRARVMQILMTTAIVTATVVPGCWWVYATGWRYMCMG